MPDEHAEMFRDEYIRHKALIDPMLIKNKNMKKSRAINNIIWKSRKTGKKLPKDMQNDWYRDLLQQRMEDTPHFDMRLKARLKRKLAGYKEQLMFNMKEFLEKTKEKASGAV
jgi:hypothetical protein